MSLDFFNLAFQDLCKSDICLNVNNYMRSVYVSTCYPLSIVQAGNSIEFIDEFTIGSPRIFIALGDQLNFIDIRVTKMFVDFLNAIKNIYLYVFINTRKNLISYKV